MASSGTISLILAASLFGSATSLPPHPVHASPIIEIGQSDLPLPRPRPRALDDEGAEETRSPAGAPLPRPRPEQIAPAEDARMAGLPRLSADEHAACMRGLDETGITAELLPPIQEEPCGMRWPLRLTEISADEEAISLTPPAKVRCPIADALTSWMETSVQPAAEQHLGGRVTGLRVSGSYVCRSRNHAAGARLSEHAIGNAIDIAAFRIDGQDWLAVGPHQNDAPGARFLTEVREAACLHFHTVLGPGSDAYHTDHFHLDLARRGVGGTRRYCR